jgi:CheY-like chemotaxis protein
MLRVFTTNNVEIFRHLGTGPFQRIELEHTVATSYDEALEKIQQADPQIAILDVDLAGGSGYSLCRAIKDNPALARIHVMMVLSSVISRQALADLDACGCDDVLAVPLHSDDFYHHIAQVAGLPVRRDRRIGVALQLQFPGLSEGLSGIVENVSTRGAGVTVDGRLTAGQQVIAALHHDGESYPEIKATVAWAQPVDAKGKTACGLAFEDVPMKTQLLLERLCLYDITAAPGGGITVALHGDFTEVTDFSALAARLHGETRIDFYMRGVRYISSAGVRAWCEFVATLLGASYSFRHGSMAFALQAAMVPLALGTGQVVSIEAPYRCSNCDRDDLRLLERQALLIEDRHVVPPVLKCTHCGADLEFDDVPDRYFAFLRSSG